MLTPIPNIETAIEKGSSLTKQSGQEVLIYICDQQLSTIFIDILFCNPTYLECLVPILGGMHKGMLKKCMH